MEEGKKNSNVLLVIVIFLVLLVIVLVAGMLYLYKEVQSLKTNDNLTIVNKETTSNVSTEIDEKQEENIDDKQEIVKKELNTEDEIVQKAYKLIPIRDFYLNSPNAYQKGRVAFNDLPNEIKLASIFKNIDFSKEQDSLSPYIENGNEMWEWWYFDAKLMEKYAKKYYGEDATFDHESFSLSWASGCGYDEEMNRYKYSKGGGGKVATSIREIEDSYIEGDSRYIIDKYLFVEAVEDNNGSILYYNVFKNSIGDILDEIDNNDENYENIENEVRTKYKDEMTEYKHTFKLNDDGNYYWVCSEPNN